MRRRTRQPRYGRIHLLTAVSLASLVCPAAHAALTLLGTQYQQDNPYTEYQCIWHDRNYPDSCGSVVMGSNVHVYLKNTGTSAVTISDVTLAGYSLKTYIKTSSTYADASSIFFYWDNPPSDILNAGEPVWYKADPSTVPPGGVAQVVVRLRTVPVTQPVSIGVVNSAGTTLNASIPVNANAPQLANVGFSSDRTKVYLHWRRSGGAAPESVWLDGVNVTSSTDTVGDSSVNFAESVLSLGTPLPAGSYHVYQGVYSDGSTATASLRTWSHEFIHASWYTFPIGDSDFDAARAWIDDATNRGVNAVENQMPGGLANFLSSSEGRAYAADHGYGAIAWNAPVGYDPLMWFLDDEPDGEEDTMPCGTGLKLPCGSGHDTGVLVMRNIAKGEGFRRYNSTIPTTVNMDGTLKPDNYYSYGQAVDVLQVDPYYQKRLVDAYIKNDKLIPLYEKATYIYAVSQAVATAAEPNPSHVILYSCKWSDGGGNSWPFPTRASKRIEVYYALAGGAKGLSYWWFKLPDGLGAQTPEALALWDEIGLLGSEIKTISPLLVTSHPVAMTIGTSTGVWAKSLASGTDTTILLVVNDDYYNDATGCHYTPKTGATVTATLPSWMQASPTAFEVTAAGLADVTSQLGGNQLQFSLGTLNLTRMIVITTNPQLRATIQQRYNDMVRPGVCAFAPQLCSNTKPIITQQPQPSTVCEAATATFNVTATGTGTLTCQWQKGQADLSDGGHYSGATTRTLTISQASSTEAGSYRCVISNAQGSTTSNSATLTVIPCTPGCLDNLGFESGFTGGVGNGWTKFIKAGSEGTNLSFSDETTQKHSGAHCQEIYSHDSSNEGGVYQQIATTPGQPYTVKVWFKVYSPQGMGIAEGFFGMDPTGGTDPNSPNILWSSKPYEYWSQDTWSVTAQANHITVYLRGRSTKDPSKNKTAYIWADDLEVAPGAPTDLAPQAVSPTAIRWKWADLAIETGYRVRDSAGADKSGVLAADTAQWLETAGINPNTLYTRHIHAINDCGESDGSIGQAIWSLSVPPEETSITASTPTPGVNDPVTWTAAGGFGPGTVQYYRYAWDQTETHTWTGSEPQWSSGTITTVPTALGPWYLHVHGYNGENVSNGTYDYAVNARSTVAADLDGDGDVDMTDFSSFQACLGWPESQPDLIDCTQSDLDLDADVDQDDLTRFQNCLSGPGNDAVPHCAD